ncbi:MAG: TRAP transporter small permease subunit [Alphaproteobacteria bacterium]|nr:TRAP transporter small permease subunit [Alphaproteobacteria bacterium]
MVGSAFDPDRIRQGLIKGLERVLGAVLAALISLEVVQVFLRYFLAEGLIWGRDVATLLLFCLAWFGASLGWLNGNHIAVDLFGSGRSGRQRRGLVLNLLMMAFAIALSVMTIRAIEAFSLIELPSLGVPAAIKFVPIIIGTMLLILASILNLAADAADQRASR